MKQHIIVKKNKTLQRRSSNNMVEWFIKYKISSNHCSLEQAIKRALVREERMSECNE